MSTSRQRTGFSRSSFRYSNTEYISVVVSQNRTKPNSLVLDCKSDPKGSFLVEKERFKEQMLSKYRTFQLASFKLAYTQVSQVYDGPKIKIMNDLAS